MTYIITHRNDESILMASDSRLNYFEDVDINGVKYQNITAVADCIQKTFYVESVSIGIQFIGIGYFKDGSEKYPLAHFHDRLEEITYTSNIEHNFKSIYHHFVRMSTEGDTGNYVKGVMTSFTLEKAYLCTFNTFNNTFKVQQLLIGDQIDSEGNMTPFSNDRDEAMKEIIQRIQDASRAKYWTIGGDIDILELKPGGPGEFIRLGKNKFDGSQTQLLHHFRHSIGKINGKILNPPKLEQYNL